MTKQKEQNSDKAGMIDISNKKVSKRIAIASAEIRMSRKVYDLITSRDGSKKGDVFETAKIAGIMGAKATPSLIPLCHPISLDKVTISFKAIKKRSSFIIMAEVNSHEKTGVEMEALTAVSVSALTFYDMLKYVDKSIIISEVKLLQKSGGMSGDFKRVEKSPDRKAHLL